MHIPDKNARDYRQDVASRSDGELIRLLQFTVETSADAIFWIMPDGRFYHVNKAACEELEYTREELLTLCVWDIDPLYTKDRWPGTWRETQTKGTLKFETLHKTKSGKLIPVEIIANYLKYDGTEYSCAFSRDITDRKRSEEALQASEAKFRATFDGIFQFLGLLTIDGTLLDVNKAALDAVAIPKSEVIGKPFWETPWCTFTDEISDNIRDSIARARQGEFVRFETVIRVADGSLRNIDYSIKPMLDENGRIILLIPEGRDITSLKQVEAALRESEEKFRVFAETSSAVIYVYQNEYPVYVNEAAERITGYSRHELLKMKFWDVIHPDYQELVRERGLARQRGEPAPSRYEIKLITKAGEERWAELNAGRIEYMGKPAGVTTFFDITERKRAEERLRLTQFAVDNFTDSSIWLDPDGRIIYVNEVTCHDLGYTRDELLSMRIWEIDPNYPYEEYAEKWKVLKKKGPIKFESIHIRKDGSSYPVEVSANYQKFEDREYEVSFDRDITERKQKEIELYDAKALVELYLDLMGHDINNMNMVALGYLELADNEIKSGGKLDKENVELIEKPITSLNDSTGLIDKVMKLRRLQAKELRLSQVDVCSVLNRIKARYSHITGRDVTINYAPAQECLVVANELIEEIFTNLIDNSLKHSPRDKPLVIDILQTTVCEDGKEFTRISVEDNGPGIPDEVKEKLFARYYRGKTSARGKGLGLYLVKILVEDFHGKIWVEDRVHGDHTKGARFVVMLPAVEQ